MSIYIQLFILCVAVAGSGYMGYLSGIHSKRNASYQQGYHRGYMESDVANSVKLRRDIRAHNGRIL